MIIKEHYEDPYYLYVINDYSKLLIQKLFVKFGFNIIRVIGWIFHLLNASLLLTITWRCKLEDQFFFRRGDCWCIVQFIILWCKQDFSWSSFNKFYELTSFKTQGRVFFNQGRLMMKNIYLVPSYIRLHSWLCFLFLVYLFLINQWYFRSVLVSFINRRVRRGILVNRDCFN